MRPFLSQNYAKALTEVSISRRARASLKTPLRKVFGRVQLYELFDPRVKTTKVGGKTEEHRQLSLDLASCVRAVQCRTGGCIQGRAEVVCGCAVQAQRVACACTVESGEAGPLGIPLIGHPDKADS